MKKQLTYCILASLILIPSVLLARQRIEAGDAQEIMIDFRGRETSVQCVDGESGKVKTKNEVQIFKSYKTILRAKKKKAKAGNLKAKKQLKRIRQLKKLGDQACGSLQGSPTPTPSAQSYFTRDGDVTDLGAVVFEMPSGVTANAFRGQTVWQINCTGCHEKRTRPTYPLLREAIAQSPMFYTEDLLSVQDGADLTAYLNLFRTP